MVKGSSAFTLGIKFETFEMPNGLTKLHWSWSQAD